MSGSDVLTSLKLKDGTLAVNNYQDVEDIVERNKRLQNEPQRKGAWGRHTATIPLNFINMWLNEEWERGNVELTMGSKEFDAIIERKLNDPDYRWLRADK